ncbi:MAG: bifunctional folylpolyglutamate synthase/dihydrofolate synthase [Thermoguttaceae bacterium]
MSDPFLQAQAILERRFNVERQLPTEISYETLEHRLNGLRRVFDALGNNAAPFEVVHIAGTKGKGSVALMLEGIVQESGYNVGTFLSPHLHTIRERFRIDGELVSTEQFCEAVFGIEDELTTLGQRSAELQTDIASLSFFDMTLLVAYRIFTRCGVNVAILEVGMGGRFDSTNVCSPAMSIVTSISYDHMVELGPTLAHIAAEKAAIVRSGVPVVSGVGDDVARKVVRHVAAERGAPLRERGIDFNVKLRKVSAQSTSFAYASSHHNLDSVVIPCLGEHQVDNAAIAIDAACTLAERGFHITPENITAGLARLHLPARIEYLSTRPTLIVDGAHNRASAAALVAALKTLEHKGRTTLIFGTMLGKDVDGMLSELLPFFDRTILTQYSQSVRAFPAQGLRTLALAINDDMLPPFECDDDDDNPSSAIIAESQWCTHRKARDIFRQAASNTSVQPTNAPPQLEMIKNCCEAFDLVWSTAERDDIVCVTGSFYLAAVIRQHFFDAKEVKTFADF